MLHGQCCFLGKMLGTWDSLPSDIQTTASLWEDHEATKGVKFELKKQLHAALEDILSISVHFYPLVPVCFSLTSSQSGFTSVQGTPMNVMNMKPNPGKKPEVSIHAVLRGVHTIHSY